MRQLISTAEHEAAHAVVARRLGVTVTTVRIDPRTLGGRTTTADAGDREDAIIRVAGDLWEREFGAHGYHDGACSDLRSFEQRHGLNRLWQAERGARAILAPNRHLVLALADRLMHTPTLRFDVP